MAAVLCVEKRRVEKERRRAGSPAWAMHQLRHTNEAPRRGESRRLAVVGVLPTAASALATRLRARRLRLETELRAQRHDPFVLEQFNGAGTLVRIAVKALHQKVDALVAELVARGKLWRISLRDMVHDGPFVVHGRPRATTGRHFEDHAAQRPDVDGAVAACAAAFDDFGGHVHWCAGHGALLAAARGVVNGKSPTLARDKLGSAEIDKLDDTVVVEEDIWTGLVKYVGTSGNTYSQA